MWQGVGRSPSLWLDLTSLAALLVPALFCHSQPLPRYSRGLPRLSVECSPSGSETCPITRLSDDSSVVHGFRLVFQAQFIIYTNHFCSIHLRRHGLRRYCNETGTHVIPGPT
ncbi:hypothetical protein K461DRAFT_71396 [Myriangium duriaei CBS 260.36]|uniref:Secreted protein n=1 Tax=Myriangium duriaei CBS 260.36 TaxID=1168546 RepID=A0A9P4MCD5_9PEZI|nr:hypothetical protein K461DRAFT_71396 [Myriangium duriaei CBS 260.36]